MKVRLDPPGLTCGRSSRQVKATTPGAWKGTSLYVAALLGALGAAATPSQAAAPAVLAQADPAAQPAALPAGPEQQTLPGQTPSTGSPASTVVVPPLFSRDWFGGVKYGAQVEGGVVLNPARPPDGLNFGHLFTDRANQATLNQVLLTVQRAVDPKATGYDAGVILQAAYGSDARYLHFVGELDRSIPGRYQVAIIQANISAHLPWLTAGGIDAKFGQYPSPLGYEPLDPSTSPFYSHSYISNFGVAAAHTGVLTTTHLNETLDLWLGLDSGNGTSLGGRSGDNNSSPAGILGFGLNGLLGGKLSVLALSHMGPELPRRLDPNADKDMRYYNDVVLTYKASDVLSFTTEVSYLRDAGLRADAYGAAQYASYAMNGTTTLNGRLEVWRDNSGAFAAAFPDNLGLAKLLVGDLSGLRPGERTTYGEATVGLTYKPAMPSPLTVFQLRPELRWDRSLNGTRPFNTGRDHGAFTAAVDAVIGF